jgi:hypothetical protein
MVIPGLNTPRTWGAGLHLLIIPLIHRPPLLAGTSTRRSFILGTTSEVLAIAQNVLPTLVPSVFESSSSDGAVPFRSS